MKSMQRRFGKFLPRTADESQVAILLQDFQSADNMLAKIIEASKAWRDSWRDILGTQQRLIHSFQAIYSPIVAADGDSASYESVVTPPDIVRRTTKLQEIYVELRADLLDEVESVETRIINPAIDAKASIQPLKKILKKREDKKLDYEKYQARVDSYRKKTKRSDRDNASLAKAEMELEHAKEDYTFADDNLKSKIPPVVSATYSILPQLLATQILIQNTLLSHLYTVLHDFCEQEGFPSPSPPMDQVISSWNAGFKPIQHEVEVNISCIARGNSRHQSMRIEDRAYGSISGAEMRNGYTQRRSSSRSDSLIPSTPPAANEVTDLQSSEPDERPRIYSVPSQTSLSLAIPDYNSSKPTSPSPNESLSHAPAGPRPDYFSRDRMASSSSLASIAAGKKKPPPPPTKRMPSTQELWVIALYEFAGEGHGDLAFKEGDRIRVVKKTDSRDDWWEGELKGIQGSFPANYCHTI